MLAVAGALEKKREHIYHAVMLDPLASSILNLEQMWQMTDSLFAAHGESISYVK
jgi:alpha-galactosidase